MAPSLKPFVVPTLTLVQVRDRVRSIAEHPGPNIDPECHGMEDDLHQDVLRAIAAGAPEPQALAAEAIQTLELPFSRWFE